MIPGAQGSYNSMPIHYVPSSMKDIRVSLVHLDDDGNVISIFRPRTCEAAIGFAPFAKDQMITIGPDCIKPGISAAINIFDKDGRQIWHKPLDEKYQRTSPVHVGEEIVCIQQQRNSETAEDFRITVFDTKRNLTFQTISLKPLREPGRHANPWKAIRTGEDEYLVDLRIYDVEQSAIRRMYPKLVLINQGQILWVRSLENILENILFLGQVKSEFIVIGRDKDLQLLAMRIDSDGNELQRWVPETVSKGSNVSFYIHENSLMSIDVPIRGTTMHIKGYTPDGIKEWEHEVETPYARLMSMVILGSNRESFIVSGTCFETETDSLYMGVVMKFDFDRESSLAQDTPLAPTRFSDDIIEEVAEEVVFVKVYPNPAVFVVNFEIDGAQVDTEYLLNIHDPSGKVLISQSNTGGTFSTDVSDLPPATYIYTISTTAKHQLLSGKIVKQ